MENRREQATPPGELERKFALSDVRLHESEAKKRPFTEVWNNRSNRQLVWSEAFGIEAQQRDQLKSECERNIRLFSVLGAGGALRAQTWLRRIA